jgi:CRISPR/Cas system-associated protein Cas5 (RAMP superfamily)
MKRKKKEKREIKIMKVITFILPPPAAVVGVLQAALSFAPFMLSGYK